MGKLNLSPYYQQALDPQAVRDGLEAYRRNGFRHEEELLDFVELTWGLHIPRNRVCPDHQAPAEYIVSAFFEHDLDCVCWANRAGGKTLNGALSTWLDSFFKPHCQTKILGGSKEQSERMYGHLRGEEGGLGLVNDLFYYVLDGEMLATKTRLKNKSSIQILTASSKSVRGPHPQKLKLDEVDEVDPKIYNAALLIPKTAHGIRASRHIYSTMHKSFGLMRKIIGEAARAGYKIFKWCVLDVLEKCPGENCKNCDLWAECQGRAVNADGFYPVHDAITSKRMVSEDTWNSEMLCLTPSTEGLIYADFDLTVHVV